MRLAEIGQDAGNNGRTTGVGVRVEGGVGVRVGAGVGSKHGVEVARPRPRLGLECASVFYGPTLHIIFSSF